MMRHTLMTLAASMLLAAACRQALAFGAGFRHFGGGPPPMMAAAEGPGMLPLPVLLSVMTPDQRAQLRDAMKAEKPAMRDLMDQLRTAHEELADRVFAPGTLTAADVGPQVKKIAALRDQLVQQALAMTLKVRGLLTPEQLAEAAKKKDRLRALHQEMRGLLGPGPGEDVGE
jgi:Spy/CpxP family protein refolding chaperone